jgi:hypothetical protein
MVSALVREAVCILKNLFRSAAVFPSGTLVYKTQKKAICFEK